LGIVLVFLFAAATTDVLLELAEVRGRVSHLIEQLFRSVMGGPRRAWPNK
jgi:hypothetical protein